MGNSCAGGTKKTQKKNYDIKNSPLDLKLREVMQAHGKSSLKSLNSLLMKFSTVGKGFQDCRNAFEEYDRNKNGTIERKELKEVLEQVEGLDTNACDEIFKNADMNGDDVISFKEFIVALTLAYFAKSKDGKMSLQLGRFEESIAVAIDAFIFFDTDLDGTLQKEEVLSTFNQATSSARSSRGAPHASRQRFEEMDWDADGTISFTEFLFALTGWAGIEDEE